MGLVVMVALPIFALTTFGSSSIYADLQSFGEQDDMIVAEKRDEHGNVIPVFDSELPHTSSTETAFYSPNPEDYLESNLIFGPDERTILPESDYTKFPYRTVCLLHAKYDTNGDGVYDKTGVGTGVLVGPRTVLTAAHVVFDNTAGVWSNTVHVFPGAHKNSNNSLVTPYGQFHSASIVKGNNHITHSSADDWAIIDLNADIGDQIGYMGVSSSLSNGNSVRLYGYHGDYNSKLGYGPGVTDAVETYKFRHNCDAIAGSSGGPVTRGTTTVVGIHSGGYNSNWDQACKVSDYIVGWVEERIGL